MAPHGSSLHANFEVDYVISYRFTDTSKAEARDDFAKLVQALARVGLQIEVRNGDNNCLLVFVRAGSDKILNHHVYRSR